MPCRSTRAIANGTLVDGTTGLSLARRDGLSRHRDGLPRRSASSSPSRWRCRSVAGSRSSEAALLGCAALTGVGAVLFAARVARGRRVLVVGAGGVGQFVVAGRADRRRRRVVVVRPGRGAARAARRAGRDACVATRTSSATCFGDALPDGADYALRRGRRSRDHRDGTPLHARRRHDGDRRPACAGLRLDLDPFELIRKEKILTGTLYGSEDPAVVAPGDAGARPRGSARALLVARAVVLPRPGRTTRSRRASPASRDASSSSLTGSVELSASIAADRACTTSSWSQESQ